MIVAVVISWVAFLQLWLVGIVKNAVAAILAQHWHTLANNIPTDMLDPSASICKANG